VGCDTVTHLEPCRRARRPTGMDDDERQALRAEGLEPADPAVVAALDLVRWERSLTGGDAS
jgi:hypothetical protein